MNRDFTVLVVEDQKENIDILVETLSPDYELLIATSGEKAMDMLDYESADLVLLDVILPSKDGYQVCRDIKDSDRYGDLPIIFLSGRDGLEDKKKGFEAGAIDYITKPFNVEEVKARVNTHLVQSAGRRLILEENHVLMREVDKKEVQLENAYKQLEFAYLETIDRLSRAAEYRDDETGFHVKRVGRISAIIAEQLGLSEELIMAIEHAAPLHDIGKIGIPEGILLKPGKLDPQEWEIMKTHCAIGKSILKNSSSNIINMAEIIAYTHHERWDGKGYPLGLKSSQIPVVSRIVAVADVYDALMSERPYKRAFTSTEALQVIIEEDGTHFSPEVVRAFLSALDEIEQVSRELRG